MKPIKLEIEGLNSFESRQVLDFEKLGDGVFGIFGKTGSGKSTILDAITLALYGKIDRIKQNVNFVNTKCSGAEASLVFEIFHAGKTRRYEVVRTFAKKKNGKELDASASLYEIVDGDKKIVEEGTNKVSDKIFSIIGLGAKEFAKCIALPQGEFSAFLQAQPAERTEIMSNIFDLTKYGEKLAASVKEKVNEYDKQMSVVSASLEMVSYATDEVLEATKTGLEDVKNNYQEASKSLEEKSNLYAKSKNSLDKFQELQNVNKQLEALEKETATIEKLSSEIERSSAANEIKTDYEKLKKSEKDEKELSDKIAELNEIKLQKASDLQSAENDFNNFKEVYDAKVAELNSKIASLNELSKFEAEINEFKTEKQNTEKKIEDKKAELLAEQENNNYYLSTVGTIQAKISAIDEFIEKNKPDVEISYALEQTKGIESELILIEDIYSKLEVLIDQTEEEFKIVQQEYNNDIKEEKQLALKREQIQKSIEVAFEDVDTTDFMKLRSCDKELEGMREVDVLVKNIEEQIQKLVEENDNRKGVVSALGVQIEQANAHLANYESQIALQEKAVDQTRETREEILGDNVISMISNHLNIGEFCPVCSNRVISKIYSETTDIATADGEVELASSKLRAMRFERDKHLANIISLKARSEYEKAQIEVNVQEIALLEENKNKLYQRFVDNNEYSKENFEKLYALLQKTADSLEELIVLQENIRMAEIEVLISKTQSGTKLSLYKEHLEKLLEMFQDLQRKKAEREFAIYNVNERYADLAEYKKQIAEGKNIELEIDLKKEERMTLRDEQIRVTEEKSKSDLKIADIKSQIEVLSEKLSNSEKQITSLTAKIMASGVPEGVSVEEEKTETDKAIHKLKFDYENKRIHFDSCKENLHRTENEYNVTSSILTSKRSEIFELQGTVNSAMTKNNFKSGEELESCFVDGADLKRKQNVVNEHNDSVRILSAQKTLLEKEDFSTVDADVLKTLESEISTLNEEVKKLSELVGKAGADLERVAEANAKFKQLSSDLETAKHNYDTAKELSTVLRGKALAEYVCEEYLQEITVSANQKLDMLMDGRYTLKFENKEFYVEDNFNDGKVRPASTLSGGETFVVSLSLALSISDAISTLSSRSMDFFFLDEGFGTLDAELCSVVISSLYKLESQNLKIGLISHVAELEESVKNRVYVTKGVGGSKIKIEHSL